MKGDSLGSVGEAYARAYLENIGYEVLEQNVRYKRNEIDIVAREGDCVVYIEVKTRSSNAYGRPCEAVTAKKRRAISAAALGLACQGGWLDSYQRFDVVEVMKEKGGFAINLIRNAFDFEPAVIM